MRKAATKILLETHVNSIYGKSYQNDRKYSNIKFATTHNVLAKYTAHSNFQSFEIFGENLIQLEMAKSTVKLIRPLFLGVIIY